MKHQLITINPLERVSKPVGGFPAVRGVAEGQEISSPEGYAYVPVIEKPDAPNGKRAVKKLTLESDGWEIVDAPLATAVQEVTPLQLRLAILNGDILSLEQLDAAIASKGAEAQIRWNYAPSIPINHPLVVELKAAFGLTDDQVEQIFIEASQII
jgi:hypothetical protein